MTSEITENCQQRKVEEIVLTPAGIDLFMGTILDLKEPMTTLRIFIEIMKRLEPNTTKASAGRKGLSDSLGMHPSRISRCLAALIRTGLIRRDDNEKGVLHVRPDLAWCGSPKDREQAAHLWSNQ